MDQHWILNADKWTSFQAGSRDDTSLLIHPSLSVSLVSPHATLREAAEMSALFLPKLSYAHHLPLFLSLIVSLAALPRSERFLADMELTENHLWAISSWWSVK